MRRIHLKALACLSLVSILMHWKTLLTHQYSLLTGYEGANQAYAWCTFVARCIKAGSWPIWDPYTFSGRTFSGEMQTAAFYPLNLLLAAVPLNNREMFSPAFYHVLYAATLALGAYFMFALVRSLGLSFFASILSGICFCFGGVMVRMSGWPHMFQSGIWLPLICLLTIKALGETSTFRAVAYSMLGGLGLGLSILAGGMHLVMTQALVVITASLAYVFFVEGDLRRKRWSRTALVAVVVLLVGATAGAVQLLPSMEYSKLSLRWAGGDAMLASEKLPYDRLERGLLPNVFFGLLLGSPAGQVASGEYLAPYLGALPLLLAALGIWKCWANPWVRYFTAMLGASFLYSLGSYSLLHGLSYVFIPFLWLAREAGRFMYLVDFSVAVLAGFGAERLFAACSGDAAWACLKKPLGWVVAGCILAMAVPAVYGKPDLSPLVSSSLLMVILSCGLVLYILHGHRGAWSRALVLSLILFDLYAFDWSASNVAQAASTGGDHLERLLSFDAAAKFLKSRGGLFRVKMAMDYAPNVGDAFGIPTLWGSGVSVPANYNKIRESSDDLLNIRYVVRPASASEPGAIYQDRFWKIYENPTYFPRAWLVHEATVDGANLDPRRTALLARPLALALDPADDSGGESVGITRYLPNSIELRVQAGGRALLVLSEVFYPGWRATVNGRSVAILEVDRALRGIPVPKGESRVVVSYAPRSVYAGAAFTLGSFFALPLAAVWLLRSRTKSGGTADYGNQST